jgi:phage-related protein
MKRGEIEKKITWLKGSRQALKRFPDEARNIAGNQLWLVQLGRLPDDWKPMTSVGLGVIEIRIHKPHEHRVLYVATFPESIYVLHAFEKKTQKTPQTDLYKAKLAYAEMQTIRQKKKGG